MYSVFITLAFFIICILGRMTNALMFYGIMKSHQTKAPLWIALDFTSGCLCLTLIAQLLLLTGYFTNSLTLSLLVLYLFVGMALIIIRNRLPYIALSYKYIFIAGMIGVAAAFLSLHEPGFWDDTSYHLIVARDFAFNGDLTPNLFLRYPYTPFNIDVLYAICFFLAGFDPIYSVYTCQAFSTAPLFMIILLLWGITYQGTKNISCALSSLVLFFALYKTSVTVHIGYAYIDYPAALFTFAAFAFLFFAHYHNCAPRNYLLPGAVCGLVAGCKYQSAAVISIVVLSVLIAMAIHRKWRSITVFASAFVIFSSYWYIRNFIQDGNPVEPFLIKWFGSNVWSYEDFLTNASDIRYLRPRGFSAIIPNCLWVLIFIWIVVVSRIVVIFRNRNRNTTKKIQYLDCVGIGLAIYSIIWIEIFPVARYLLPALGILIFYTVIIINHYLRKIHYLFLFALLIAAIGYRLTLVSSFSWDKYNKQRELFEIASTLADSKSDRTLTIDVQERNKFFFDGITIGDQYGNARFSNFYASGTKELVSPEEFLKAMELWKTRFAIVSNDVLKKYRINDFKRLFHVIKYNPGQIGGLLLEPLKPISACIWGAPHSSWTETNTFDNVVSNREDLRIFVNSESVNLAFCKERLKTNFFLINLRLGELEDWNNIDGNIIILDNNGKKLTQSQFKNVPVEYDDEGHRIRTISFNIPREEYLKKIKWLEIKLDSNYQIPKIRLDNKFIYLSPIDQTKTQ